MSLCKINDLKYFLKAYKVGNFTHSFPDAGIGEMEDFSVRIGLFGITGSGKSSFINSVVMALNDDDVGPAVTQSTGAEGTIILETFPITDRFTLLDTRGFDCLGGDAEQEILAILNGDIRDESCIDRKRMVKTSLAGKGTNTKDETHIVLWFVNAMDPRLHRGAYSRHMDFLRHQLFRRGVLTMTILTHEDMLDSKGNTPEERHKLSESAREITGSFHENTYFLSNFIKGKEFSDENRLKVLEIIKRSLELSESTIKTRQTKKRLASRLKNT
ncbi:uncharacterized protein LOC118419357 [Branchiostoma floridae]|uniref:Uncharacterized protein LOC118419357 n=1 Tax=Branchiostoma floridae TaxID=7739 RepID=A0A9J7LFS3_BRAFL|nr:uncharacterized protein LOC118419357 [Branchiostoma floridae]